MSVLDDRWIEARLKPGRHPQEVYDYLDYCPLYHHFWDEPWWPDAYVVRLLAPLGDYGIDRCGAVDHFVEWDATPDEELYGEDWGRVRDFFHAASALGEQSSWKRRKLVHCFLNSQGMSVWDEFCFAVRMAWQRATITIRWKLYLERQWKKAQQ